MIFSHSRAAGMPTVSPNGVAPRCDHLDRLVPVIPQSDHCQDCRGGEDRQAVFLVCLTCGRVTCSGDSSNQHAKAHYEETDHPVARRLAPESRWTWCYVHRRLV
jgi:uncharacterized UBP type Zn finger protein